MTAGIEQERRRLLAQALAEGRKALDQGNFGQAREYFDEALKIERDNPEARAGLQQTNYREKMALGRQALEAHEFDRAAEYFRQAQKLEVAGPEARCLENVARGQQALDRGDFPTAKAFFQKATEIDRESAEARAGLTQTYLRAGEQAEQKKQLKEAQDYYRALLQFDPDNDDARVRLNAVTRRIRQRKTIWLSTTIPALVIVISFIFLQVKGCIRWPEPCCTAPGIGPVLCTPTFTPTHTPTFTLTPTPTYTPTPTLRRRPPSP
jgi:tetratricopeptide (TPR) repeat protein